MRFEAQIAPQVDRLSRGLRALHHLGGRPLAGRSRRRARPSTRRRAASSPSCSTPSPAERGVGGAGAHPAVPRPVGRRQDASDPRAAHRRASRRQGLLRLRADDAGRRQLRRLLPAPPRQLAGEALRPRPGRRERACPPHQPAGRRQGRARSGRAREAARGQAQRRAARQAGAGARRRDRRRAQVRRPEPRHQHRARAALSAALATRASTSACASTSTAAS